MMAFYWNLNSTGKSFFPHWHPAIPHSLLFMTMDSLNSMKHEKETVAKLMHLMACQTSLLIHNPQIILIVKYDFSTISYLFTPFSFLFFLSKVTHFFLLPQNFSMPANVELKIIFRKLEVNFYFIECNVQCF